MKLSNRTILVTGGASGIGLAFAAEFIELGNEVIAVGRRREALEAAKARLPTLHILVADVSDLASVRGLAATMAERFPKLDVLMNNAGIMRYHNLARPGDDLVGLTAEVDTNLTGLIRLTAALMGQLTANHGAVINVGSGLGWVPLPASPIYCATKAAVHSYTISLRLQLREAGVEVVELIPPATDTDFNRDLPPDANVKLISVDTLVAQALPGLLRGDPEINVGQAAQLHWMSRIAPRFIQGQLYTASKGLIPKEG